MTRPEGSVVAGRRERLVERERLAPVREPVAALLEEAEELGAQLEPLVRVPEKLGELVSDDVLYEGTELGYGHIANSFYSRRHAQYLRSRYSGRSSV